MNDTFKFECTGMDCCFRVDANGVYQEVGKDASQRTKLRHPLDDGIRALMSRNAALEAELGEVQLRKIEACSAWADVCDERDKLEAELAAAKADYQREHEYITVVVSERDTLRAENAALREKLAGLIFGRGENPIT